MREYQIRLTGKTPLLMHRDNIEWADFMDAWRVDPANKNAGKAGDDRTPAWRWLGCLYHDGNVIGLPAENIMRSIMEGGVMVPVPGGKNGKTFKSQTQSGMRCGETLWPIEINGGQLSWPDTEKLKDETDFKTHRTACEGRGFALNVKRAKVGQSKHIRVRPEFPAGWTAEGTILVWDNQITPDTLSLILDYAGQYKGIGDWRPGGKTPGPYGIFTAEILS